MPRLFLSSLFIIYLISLIKTFSSSSIILFDISLLLFFEELISIYFLDWIFLTESTIFLDIFSKSMDLNPIYEM